jgi:predicted  nucleic acid-binding Zn-ribbon protein
MDWKQKIYFNFNDVIANGACFVYIKKGAMRRQIQILVNYNNKKLIMYESKKPHLQKNMTEATEIIHSRMKLLEEQKIQLIKQYTKENKKAKNVDIENTPALWNYIRTNPRIDLLLREIKEAEKKRNKYMDDMTMLDRKIFAVKSNAKDLEESIESLESDFDEIRIGQTLSSIYSLRQDNLNKSKEVFADNITNKKMVKKQQIEMQNLQRREERILTEYENEEDEDNKIDDDDDILLTSSDSDKKYFLSNLNNDIIGETSSFSSSSSSSIHNNNNNQSSIFSDYQ